MPIDDYGIRADLVIDPNAHVARMTIGPLYEPAINRTSEFVRRKLQSIYPIDPQYATALLLDYYNDINPNYAKVVQQVEDTPAKMAVHVEDCIKTRINLWIPPGLDTIGLELISKLKRKWEVPISPVTYTQLDIDNTIIGTFRTKTNVCIGSKYVYLLCKIPEAISPGVAAVNQYNTPMKPHPADRIKHPISRSPIRSGEDEIRIMSMDMKDPSEIMRVMCNQGNSPKGVETTCWALLNEEFPTRIRRIDISNDELLRSNTVIQVFNHLMSTMGIGSSTKGPHPLLSDLLDKDDQS